MNKRCCLLSVILISSTEYASAMQRTFSFEESFNIDEDDIFGYNKYLLKPNDEIEEEEADIEIPTQKKTKTIDLHEQIKIACSFKDQGCEALLSKSRKIIHEEYYCFYNKTRVSYWCYICECPVDIQMINIHPKVKKHNDLLAKAILNPLFQITKIFEKTTLEDIKIQNYLLVNKVPSYMMTIRKTKQQLPPLPLPQVSLPQAPSIEKEVECHWCKICDVWVLYNIEPHNKSIMHIRELENARKKDWEQQQYYSNNIVKK